MQRVEGHSSRHRVRDHLELACIVQREEGPRNKQFFDRFTRCRRPSASNRSEGNSQYRDAVALTAGGDASRFEQSTESGGRDSGKGCDCLRLLGMS